MHVAKGRCAAVGRAAQKLECLFNDRQRVRRGRQYFPLRVEQERLTVVETNDIALQPLADLPLLLGIEPEAKPVRDGDPDKNVFAQHVGVAKALLAPIGDLLDFQVGNRRELLLRLFLDRFRLVAIEKIICRADAQHERCKNDE